MRKILYFGEILRDNFPTKLKSGGAPMNTAFHFTQLEYKLILAYNIGNDNDGKELEKFIENANINSGFYNLIIYCLPAMLMLC